MAETRSLAKLAEASAARAKEDPDADALEPLDPDCGPPPARAAREPPMPSRTVASASRTATPATGDRIHTSVYLPRDVVPSEWVLELT